MEIVWSVVIGVALGLVVLGAIVWHITRPPEEGHYEAIEVQSADDVYRNLCQQRFVSDVIYFLQMLEKLIYLSDGDSVKKEYLLMAMLRFGEHLEKESEKNANTEGTSIYRYGNYGLEPQAEQTLINWTRGLEKRASSESTGNPGMG